MLDLEAAHRGNLFISLRLAEYEAPCYLILPEAISLLFHKIIFTTSLFGVQNLIHHNKGTYLRSFHLTYRQN
jgi:hypothetical protein